MLKKLYCYAIMIIAIFSISFTAGITKETLFVDWAQRVAVTWLLAALVAY